MATIDVLRSRSGECCELCGAKEDLEEVAVGPSSDGSAESSLIACRICHSGIANPLEIDANHWRCLTDSMWSEHDPVKVTAWRILNSLAEEGWTHELLDMLYLDENQLAWAKAGLPENGEDGLVHRDSNGAILSAGDSVTLIKDLPVKGANFTAKRGTAVRGISLVQDNAEHIEGRVNSQRIVILTQYVKKSN